MVAGATPNSVVSVGYVTMMALPLPDESTAPVATRMVASVSWRWVSAAGVAEAPLMGYPTYTRPLPGMSKDAYRLNALDVYGRLGIAGVAISPDGRTLAYTHVRERRAEEDKDAKRIKVTTLGDVFLLPAAGGFPRQLTNSGDVAQAPVW